MAPEVIKNTVLKIGHQLTAEDDRNLMGGTMSASAAQLEQMATYGVGEALVATEGLLRPYKAQICKWQEEDAAYDPPSDEELVLILAGHKERVSPVPNYDPPSGEEPSAVPEKRKGPVYNYDYQLGRNTSICCAKLEKELCTLLDNWIHVKQDYEKFDDTLVERLDKMTKNWIQVKQDPGKPLPSPERHRIQQQKLDERLAEWFSSMVGLYHKAIGHHEQNWIYGKRIFNFIRHLQNSWINSYECAKSWHHPITEKHKRDHDEITGFTQE
jgi:hypothetical protein